MTNEESNGHYRDELIQRPVSPPPKPETPYTANFCEENIYKLIEHFQYSGTSQLWDIHAVFISNLTSSVFIWQQRIASERHLPVCWDYHVVAFLKSKSCSSEAWIYDFDSLLPIPAPLNGMRFFRLCWTL